MRRVLVTGGLGFLGSCLVERLVELGDVDVHVVDNMSSNAVGLMAFRDHLAPALKAKGATVEMVHASVHDLVNYALPKFDEIYHLASVVGPVGVLSHAGTIAHRVTTDAHLMTELAIADGARLCDVSTSEVYGAARPNGLCLEHDAKVITSKTSARLEYAVGKHAAEVALINRTKTSGLFGVVVRPFNIAGPRQSPAGGFVLPRFIHQALAGKPLTVYGDGSAVRAFTHVKDVADGIVRALRHGKTGEAYNLGNAANKTTILELAHRVSHVVDDCSGRHRLPAQIAFVDPKTLHGPAFEEASDKWPDATKAMSELGWRPQHDLDKIIFDTLDHVR